MLFFRLLAFNLTKKTQWKKKKHSNTRETFKQICLKRYCAVYVSKPSLPNSRTFLLFCIQNTEIWCIHCIESRMVHVEWKMEIWKWHTISLCSKPTEVINIEDLKHLISGHLYKLKLQINTVKYERNCSKCIKCFVWPFVMQMVI